MMPLLFPSAAAGGLGGRVSRLIGRRLVDLRAVAQSSIRSGRRRFPSRQLQVMTAAQSADGYDASSTKPLATDGAVNNRSRAPTNRRQIRQFHVVEVG